MIQIQYIFPTLTAFEHDFLSGVENETLASNCLELVPKTASRPTYWLSGTQSPFTTVTTLNIAKHELFHKFVGTVTAAVHDFARQCNDLNTYECDLAWFNIYSANNFQEPHMHANARYAAVYFAKAPYGSGSLVLQNPYMQVNVEPNSKNDNPNWIYPALERTLIIFPAHIVHYVLPGSSTEPRISLAFNYTPVRKN
jgi:uncharacterized protein (TIGR02466 family)